MKDQSHLAIICQSARVLTRVRKERFTHSGYFQNHLAKSVMEEESKPSTVQEGDQHLNLKVNCCVGTFLNHEQLFPKGPGESLIL